MRINREALLKVAENAVTQRVRGKRDLIAAYLCGSLLEEDYLLAGTGDVDLVLIHFGDIPTTREIVRLTDEIHLDIAHHAYSDYEHARGLRTHPWLGPTINACKALHDPQHFMDFTQASVRGQFDRADYVLERAGWWLEEARHIWSGLLTSGSNDALSFTSGYLQAAGFTANAVASLGGPPLTERRFLLEFPKRAQLLGRPGLAAGLLGLLGSPNLTLELMLEWLAAWQDAYQSLPASRRPPRLHADRRLYYQKLFETALDEGRAEEILWPFLCTWTLAVSCMSEDSLGFTRWSQAMETLGLIGDMCEQKLEALDAYLDLVEETVEQWGLENGA